jgi:hypothetical protein
MRHTVEGHDSMASDDSSSGIDLDTLLGALPACKRCRKTRRRYDLSSLLISEVCVLIGPDQMRHPVALV